jgi:uncharacterized protein YjbI with pentapeptide repeats
MEARSICVQRAFLWSATLSGADLEKADLSGANLAYARLDGANLKYASLSGAILDYTDLKNAELTDANLSGANLRHVQNLSQDQIKHSICDGATILPPHLVRPTTTITIARPSDPGRSHIPIKNTFTSKLV